MNTEEMVPASEFCLHHNIELSLIYSLQDSGLIRVIRIEESIFIHEDQLPDLEKILRLYEMDINLEGIETISYLLDRMQKQQEKITRLTNRLRNYETDKEIEQS